MEFKALNINWMKNKNGALDTTKLLLAVLVGVMLVLWLNVKLASNSASLAPVDEGDTSIVPALFVLLIGIFIYFIPYIVATSNKKSNTAAIGALNLFLGWTLIGWVLALVWAMSKDVQQPAPQVQVTMPAALPTPPPAPAAQKKCPDCAEMVLAEARKCRFCGHEFVAPATR